MDFSRIFIFEPPDFSADFLAGFFLLIFVGKSAQKNPPGKSPGKSSKMFTTEILQHISADCPGQDTYYVLKPSLKGKCLEFRGKRCPHKVHRNSLGQKSCRTKASRIFRIFVPNFAPNFAPNFPRIFRGLFVLRFVGDGDQKKFTKNPRHFSMQNSQANTKKIFTKFFWRAGRVTIVNHCAIVKSLRVVNLRRVVLLVRRGSLGNSPDRQGGMSAERSSHERSFLRYEFLLRKML